MTTRFNKLIMIAATAASFAAVLPAQAQSRPDDAAIAASVKAALANSREFQDKAADVIVNVNQGRVNLSGWVTYASDIDDAEKVAASVSGVRRVTANFRTWSSDERP